MPSISCYDHDREEGKAKSVSASAHSEHLAFGGLISSLCSRGLLFQVLSHSYQRSKTFRRRRSKVGVYTAVFKAVIACLSTLTNQVSTIKYTQIDLYLSMDKMYIFLFH